MANKRHVEVVRAGAKALNEWRAKNPDVLLDLHGADLTAVDLSAERLPGPEFIRDRSVGDSRVLTFRHNIARANLRSADLRKSRLRSANLADVDLRDARLDGATVREAALPRATLGGASLIGVEMSWSDLGWADLTAAKMRGSEFVRVDFTGADLRHADLGEGEFSEAKFHEVLWQGCRMNGAQFSRTVFGAVDLTHPDLRDSKHFAPSSVGIDTLELSAQSIAKEPSKLNAAVEFLRGCGLSEDALRFFNDRVGAPIQFFSVFISYSTKDEEFASRLYSDLQSAGIRCWKWDHDARTGRSLWGEVDSAIRLHDRVVLIASKNSLCSPAVNREIERAIQQEDARILSAGSGQRDVLFPIRLDDYVFRHWENERKPDVIRKVIADATGWHKSPKRYREVLNRLIRDLRA